MDICVYDFSGYTEQGHFPLDCWADYEPDQRTTIFGGDWHDIPPMPSGDIPDEDAVNNWVVEHTKEEYKP